MGEEGSSTSPPPAPGPSETASAAIQAQVTALPRIYEAQKEYGPKFTQLELENLQRFGPQFLEEQVNLQEEFAPRLAETTREAQRVLAPERIAGQEVLTDYLNQENLLTDSEAQQFRADTRAAQSSRGLAQSGFGALDEIRQLSNLRNNLKMQRINVALSAAGAVPTTPQATVGIPNTSTGQLVQNINPSDIFSQSNSNFSTQASIYGTNVQAKNQERQQWFDLAGSAIGAGGQIGAAKFMPAPVA